MAWRCGLAIARQGALGRPQWRKIGGIRACSEGSSRYRSVATAPRIERRRSACRQPALSLEGLDVQGMAPSLRRGGNTDRALSTRALRHRADELRLRSLAC